MAQKKAATPTTTVPPPSAPGGFDPAKALAEKQQAFAGGTVHVDDPPVFTGGRWVHDPLRESRRWQSDPEGKVPTSQAYSMFYGLSPEELRDFQEQAFAAGLYDKKKREDVAWGDYDEDSFLAWRKMVDRSAGFLTAGKKVSPWQALSDATKKAPAAAGPARGPLVVKLSNREDLKAVLGRALTSVTGGAASLSPEEMDAFVAQVHDIERRAQRQEYEAGGSGLPGGPGGEIEKPGDANEMARKRIHELRPKEAQTYSYLESYQTFRDLLRASS